MGSVLKNKSLEIKIDFPLENYNFSRFDWTGKIVNIKFNNISVSGVEDPNCENENFFGKGLYNEFGINTALGFEEAQLGEWFHKIGVGALKKDGSHYEFNKAYKIEPAEFKINTNSNSIVTTCTSALINGYAYILTKEIKLHETSFTIHYSLKNTGQKTIQTDEYTHNFLAINKDAIGEHYSLNFPFDLKPKSFDEMVNHESVVVISKNGFSFNCTPNEQFFFSNLSGEKSVSASWELVNAKTKIGIRERTSFQTNKINLWGWNHVISPELFHKITVAAGESTEWSRTYEVFEI